MLFDAILGTGNRVTSAIRSASQSTGINFDYLLKTAIRESSLDPKAAATTSSARGLFQFIEPTWLMTVKEDGPAYGLQNEANAIERTANGQYIVRDPAARARILKLRENPEIASVMAGAFSRRNSAEIQSVLGRQPTSGELYIAHFLGANGAKRLLAMRASQPEASAAAAFPTAANANRSIFFSGKSARSVDDVYRVLVAKHDGTRPAAPATAFAARGGGSLDRASPDGISVANLFNRIVAAFGARHAPPASVAPRSNMVARPTAVAAVNNVSTTTAHVVTVNPQTAAAPTTTATNVQPELRPTLAANEAPIFRGLFQNQTNGPLSADVRALWGGVNPMARRAGS